MVKVLIFGGAGFIGSYISKEFLSRNHEVIIFDAFIQYIPSQKVNFGALIKKRLEGIEDKIICIRGDSRNRSEVQDAIMDNKPNIIIQLSSLPISTLSNVHVEEAVSSCIISAMNILE